MSRDLPIRLYRKHITTPYILQQTRLSKLPLHSFPSTDFHNLSSSWLARTQHHTNNTNNNQSKEARDQDHSPPNPFLAVLLFLSILRPCNVLLCEGASLMYGFICTCASGHGWERRFLGLLRSCSCSIRVCLQGCLFVQYRKKRHRQTDRQGRR